MLIQIATDTNPVWDLCAEQRLLCSTWSQGSAQFIVVNNMAFHSPSLPKIFLILALALKQMQEGGVF